jgi:hypothetical protein
VRNELLQQRRAEFFEAFMAKARERMEISYNDTAVQAVLTSP